MSTAATPSSEYGFVKIRYKLPKSDRSQLISTPIDRRVEFARFADAPQIHAYQSALAATTSAPVKYTRT